MRTTDFTRRAFIRHGLALAAGAPLASLCARTQLLAAEAAAGADQTGFRAHRAAAKVASGAVPVLRAGSPTGAGEVL